MLIGSKLKKTMEARLIAALTREMESELSANPAAAASHRKLAAAISDIALDIIDCLLSDAQIAPGIPVATVGGPTAQSGTTTAPGKLV